ncbi:MAG: ammonia-forming cytochrome c nitrite reductase subunit c552 [Methylotetracoccus sp.]
MRNSRRRSKPATKPDGELVGRHRWRVLATAVVALALALLALVVWNRPASDGPQPTASPSSPPSSPQIEQHVGSSICAECHKAEYEAWRGSDHALAMQVASPDTVLGNFEGAKFRHGSTTSRFLRRDGRYVVETDGPDGRLTEFPIKYTFGVKPLQQYLIELSGGRLQALSIAWDARSRSDGGQRWYHLYPNEIIDHRDPLHWTGPYQNWNYMCADCHSTHVQYNYDAKADRLDTRWSEISVACEACHGPGSQHVSWARGPRTPGVEDPALAAKGLAVHLKRTPPPRPAQSPADTTPPSSFDEPEELNVCARCHSRRTALTNAFRAADGFEQHYLPALLTADLYHVDGQILDEVYEYNSFRQSRMFSQGVRCSHCHEPHSLALRGDPQTVCLQCHAAERYVAVSHDHHPRRADARCVDCHMPSKTYMGIDKRRDHSFRVPRPDLSASLGVPDACGQCHKRGPDWSAARVRKWLGRDAKGFQQFAGAFDTVRSGGIGAERSLRDLLRAESAPPLVKGSLLAAAGQFVGAIPDELTASLASSHSAQRLGALRALEAASPEERWHYAAHLLEDPIRHIRIEAARMLMAPNLDDRQRQRIERPLHELREAAETYVSVPSWRLISADLNAREGRIDQAIADYEAALRIQPVFGRAYVNLADLYRGLGDEQRARAILDRGLAVLPEDGALHYALGLHFVRIRETARGMQELKRATELSTDDAGFAYAYAVGLDSTGHAAAAMSFLHQRLAHHPSERQSLYLLTQLALQHGKASAVRPFERTLERLGEDDPDARRLLDWLDSSKHSSPR